MNKVKSLEALRQLQASSAKDIEIRTTGENPDHIIITVGMGTCGIAKGARGVMNALLNAIDENNASPVSVVASGCFGYCYAEPMVSVQLPNKELVRYTRVDEAKAKAIVEKHVMQGIALDGALTGNEVPKHE